MIEPVSLSLIFYAMATAPAQETDLVEVAKNIKSGDHQAFQYFFDLHYESLLRFLISKNTARETAKDLIQKAFIYIWEHRNRIDPNKSLRAYLFQIVYTRMLNHHRDNKKFNSDEAVPNQKTERTPEDFARVNDLKRAIDQAIENMPEKRGTVFQLCFMDDLTYKEAAQALDVSVKTIENHMGLAFKDLRRTLKNYR